MSNDTPAEAQISDDLDTFSESFFGQKESVKEPTSSEESKTEEKEDSTLDSDIKDKKDTQPESDEDDESSEDNEDEDTLAPEGSDDTEEEEVEAEAEKPKPRKNRSRERIEELNTKFREEERKRQDVERRLEELTKKFEQNDQPKPVIKQEADTGPQPDDVTDDGTDKYPLGEFDPNYIRDLTKHTFKVEGERRRQEEVQEQAQKAAENERGVIAAEWQGKLEPARERYPDFQDKSQELLDTFNGLDPSYGEYLATAIMTMEYGPDVLYHLANNKDEAKKIVGMGAAKATLALGRLEAKFADASEEKKQARPKVSKAPVPPERVNKGSAVSKAEVDDDTDDLDAFATKLFKKGRR